MDGPSICDFADLFPNRGPTDLRMQHRRVSESVRPSLNFIARFSHIVAVRQKELSAPARVLDAA